MMELIGHLSKDNKETYLKHAQPLQKYIDVKDEFDFKHNNYTTTENVDKTPNENVRHLQRELNEAGYTDKFGQPLKEDGIYAGKTSYADDSRRADNPNSSNSITDNNRYKTATVNGKEYQVEHLMGTKDDLQPKMWSNSEVELAKTNYSAQLTSNSERLGDGIWSFKNDSPGIEILYNWLYGDGKEFVREDGYWGEYMKDNKILKTKVRDIVLPLADELKNNESKNIDMTTSMEMENGEDIIGYQYLHGTNSDVGGFQIKGEISKDKDGNITYDLKYTWNDKIDPNYMYLSDSKKAKFAESIPFADPEDYVIRISWNDKTVIKAKPGWFNWNSGWLK